MDSGGWTHVPTLTPTPNGLKTHFTGRLRFHDGMRENPRSGGHSENVKTCHGKSASM